MSAVTINQQQSLFVIPCGDGFSSLGFDVAFKRLKQIVEYLNLTDIPVREDDKGTLGQYELYQKAVQKATEANIKETWFNLDTPVAVRRVLESYRKSGEKIRLFLGDQETGRDWMDENDVIGRVSRSGGAFKVPLLIADGDFGGPAMLDSCIVKLMDVATRKVLWEHPKYHIAGTISIEPRDGRYAVCVNGETHATFVSFQKAAAWVGFISGETMENVL